MDDARSLRYPDIRRYDDEMEVHGMEIDRNYEQETALAEREWESREAPDPVVEAEDDESGRCPNPRCDFAWVGDGACPRCHLTAAEVAALRREAR